ncbi:hypothetical protein M5D96_002444 [Drosophila gunungcola]|uniref:Uncharacterized protein n=1 Tax=Drosophila gunungcola TaxID=103775 RepID=A0A9P9Z007_9MUSC|nr:hypothetical protein M5D96_002444 [Drosophila gunungcola]
MKAITLCLLVLVSATCLLTTQTVRGTNCIIKEVVNILSSCTNYVDAIDACGTEIPKDVAKIVEFVQGFHETDQENQ